VEGEPVYLRAGVARPGGPNPSRRNPLVALPAVFDSIRTIAGGSCVVSKRIANNLRIPLLAEVFPAARFVGLGGVGGAGPASLSGAVGGRGAWPLGDLRSQLGGGVGRDRRRAAFRPNGSGAASSLRGPRDRS